MVDTPLNPTHAHHRMTFKCANICEDVKAIEKAAPMARRDPDFDTAGFASLLRRTRDQLTEIIKQMEATNEPA